MDISVIELYCKYIVKPIEEKKNQLERELLTTGRFNRSIKEKELVKITQLFNEKLIRLTELIYSESE